jgi:hypothetical protein
MVTYGLKVVGADSADLLESLTAIGIGKMPVAGGRCPDGWLKNLNHRHKRVST